VTFHCFFEQSGTFKNVFKSYGHAAFDYDLFNEYGQTDFQIDLFAEIENAYNDLPTVFDKMSPERDFIIAFFPCTYFTDQQELSFRLQNYGYPTNNNFTDIQIERLLNKIRERERYFSVFIKFCFVCQERKISLIIENPANISKRSFLELYSPYRPSFYEKNRTLFGDDFIKPTMFIAINFEMRENFIGLYYDKNYDHKKIRETPGKSITTGDRSRITPTYADNFYKRFIKDWITTKENYGKSA